MTTLEDFRVTPTNAIEDSGSMASVKRNCLLLAEAGYNLESICRKTWHGTLPTDFDDGMPSRSFEGDKSSRARLVDRFNAYQAMVAEWIKGISDDE
jgi:hypothetical protein